MSQRRFDHLRMTFGLFTPIVQPLNAQPWEDAASPEDLVAVVAAAESHGFDFATVGDHAGLASEEGTLYGSTRFYDPIATIGFLAASTSRLRLVTHIYQVPLRSPLITAKAFATLDVLTGGGRVVAGFGVGRREYESKASGIEFSERGAAADDFIAAITELWSGEPTSRHTRFCDYEDIVCRPHPVDRRMPIWIGGDRLVGLRRALRFGEGWTPWALRPEQVSRAVGKVCGTGAFVRPRDFRIVVPIAPLGGRAPRGEVQPAPDVPGPAAVDRCLQRIEIWRGAGATDFIVDMPSRSRAALLEGMEWFASEVLPHVQQERPCTSAGA